MNNRLAPVQYKRTTIQRLHYAMKRAAQKRTTAQKRYKKDFDEKARFWIEIQPDDQVYIDRPPRRVQCPESKTIDQVGRYSDNLEQPALTGSPKLFFLTTSLCIVRSITKSTVTTDKDEVAIPESLTGWPGHPKCLMTQRPPRGFSTARGSPRGVCKGVQKKTTLP